MVVQVGGWREGGMFFIVNLQHFSQEQQLGCGRASCLPAIHADFENVPAKSLGILAAADQDKLG